MNNLNIVIGKDERGLDINLDLDISKHLLVAGCTGSGKSVLLHNIITKLSSAKPHDLKFILIDPKRVELTLYNGLPNLLTEVITEPKKAILAMKWTCKEIYRRYDEIKDNQKNSNATILIVIDEFSDIIQSFPKETEPLVTKIAEMGHVVGVHILISTSRPSTKVLTPALRSVIRARIALQTASVQDSNIIIDTDDAYTLRGHGDMFFQSGSFRYPIHGQINNISEKEIKKFVMEQIKNRKSENAVLISLSHETEDDNDEMYEQAKEAVVEAGKASTSFIQRKLGIGYSRSAHLIDMLEDRGVIGHANGAEPRKVIQESSTIH